jgi:D-3-phosphoglycerate dehydrogenase
MLILISDAFDPSLPDLIAKYGDVTDDKDRLPEAHVVLVRSKTKCTKEYIDSAPNLKMIIRGGVGIDNIDVSYAESKGIKVLNTAEASSIAVAELAFALMLSIPNRICRADSSLRQGEWLKKQLKRRELYGKTLGLIGMGRIATEVAKRAKVFGMRTLAYDPYVDVSDYAELRLTLDDFLPECDYISMHVPLTSETERLIDADTIAKMKDGVIIINTGRGKCVDETAVAKALKEGKIAGYGNDVWQSDPPQDTPLMSAPNTVLTPHIGSSTVENLLRIGKVIDRILGEHFKPELKQT